MRRSPFLLVALAMAVVAVACSSGGKPAAAPVTAPPTEAPTSSSSSTSTTARPTTTTTSTIPRTTVTTALTVGPGNAFLSGTVTGPQGPVDGATVRVERLVGKAVATADVLTAGGSWQLPSVLGGSYRVRAFKSPELAQSDVQTFFLAANERKVVDFALTGTGGDRITAVINPSPPRVDQVATLTVTVGVARVDDQGRPALTPRPNVLLTLNPGPGQALESPAQVLTDGNGAGSWRIRCVTEGTNPIGLTVGTGATSINLPGCAAASAAPPTTRTG
jgi:hypothetical protein